MKEGWKYKRLGDIATYVNGFAFKPEDWTTEGLPIIRIQNLTESNKVYNYCKRKDIPAKFHVFDGDVLISWSATLGVFEWSGGEALLNQHIFKVLFDKEEINKQYYKYAIMVSIAEMSKHTNGATMRHIRKGDFDNIQIPVPPLPEQQRIVELLDAEFAKIDSIRANADQQLRAAKDLFQAVLKEMLTPKVGWESKIINDIISNLRTGLNPRVHFKLNTPDATGNYITVRELKGFTIEVDEKTDKVNNEALKRINKRSNLLVGDVLFSGTGTIGNTALVTEEPLTWNIKEGIYALTPKHDLIDSKYMIYYISSNFFLNGVQKFAEGTGVRSIPMKRFINLPIVMPNIQEQQHIVKKLDLIREKCQQLQSNYDNTLTFCNDLKQKLLKSIFE